MRHPLLILATVILLVAPLCADEPMSKSEAEARAALALAKAKAKMPALAAQTRAVPYETAKTLALKQHKPIFLTVKLNCAGLCGELRPQFLTCHEEKFEGSPAPRAVLIMPDSSGNLWRVKTWTDLPNALQVRQAAVDSGKATAEPQDPSLDALMAMFVAGLVAVEPGMEYTQAAPAWTQACVGGRCNQTPAGTGYVAAPASSSTTVVEEKYVADGGGGQFVAHFPRLARFRGRVRGAMGLPPPHVAGGYVSFPAPAMPMQQPAVTAAPNPPPAGPMAVAGPAADFVQVGPHHVPHTLIRRAHGAGMNLSQVIEFILKYGVPLLEELLKALGK